MTDYTRIILTGYLDVDPEDLDQVSGDATQAAQNELGFTGLTVTHAEVSEYIDDGDLEPDDVVSLDALDPNMEARDDQE